MITIKLVLGEKLIVAAIYKFYDNYKLTYVNFKIIKFVFLFYLIEQVLCLSKMRFEIEE
ncbi:hypothetical protein GCM10022271_07460 [Corallibacter vietnamensis]|uniref:Uncharacterized protein n=1 Tax=Corallibacter vietnamensis TaxID=904130 RepID=A0ABP7H3Y8_9FLAO